jgi:hypothetical protein
MFPAGIIRARDTSGHIACCSGHGEENLELRIKNKELVKKDVRIPVYSVQEFGQVKFCFDGKWGIEGRIT